MKMQVMKSFGVLLMNVLMFVALGLSRPVRADVFSNVPEASSYTLVYTLPIPTGADLNKNAIPYSVDNSAGTPATFDRVAYYLELQSGAGALQYVFVSFDKLAGMTASNQIGVPNVASGEFYQALLANMNVASNVAGLTTGTGIATGNIEFWPSNYSTPNDNSVPNADGSTYDFGDGGADTSAGYGSMQLHNYDVDGAGAGTVGQTLLAYNQWGSGGGELGIDNQSSGNPDWTFAGNVASYTVRNLQILVRLPDTAQTTPNFVVNNTADYDDGTCGVAHCTLREAINAANSNTDASLITFSSLFNSAQTVMVDNDLPAISAETTLTGPGATLLTVQENGAAQLLDIFTVSNRARATFSALTISGGYDGIFNRNGTLMLADCTFSDNRAALESRGTATATVTNCLFSDNIYGVANIGGTALTTDCTFSDNDLGTLVYGGTLTSTNCTFRRNSYGIATDIGGDATANGCTFRPNLYGVYNGDGTVQVTNSIFSGNFDGIHNEVGTATVTNSSFSANDVGIHNLDATPVTNCTFNNNSFGIYNEGGALTTTNCTLSGNNDKGIFVFGGTVNVQNSIVAGNTNFDIDGTFTNGGSNIIGGTALAAGLETDGTGKPLLRHNGGPTPSIAIVPGSPAHGNANPATTPVTDQRGFLRPLPGVGKPDIGAVELEVLVTSNPVVTETPGGTIASFIVDLGSPALRVITFDAVTSDYSALAGSDYIARALKSYSIGIGQSNKVITVPILDDNVDEIQETFLLLLSNSNKASIRANGGILGGRATIIDDDAVPTVSVADLPGVREGSSGTQNRSFTVKLSAPGTKTAVVDYAFNGTATYGTDYNAPAGNSAP